MLPGASGAAAPSLSRWEMVCTHCSTNALEPLAAVNWVPSPSSSSSSSALIRLTLPPSTSYTSSLLLRLVPLLSDFLLCRTPSASPAMPRGLSAPEPMCMLSPRATHRLARAPTNVVSGLSMMLIRVLPVELSTWLQPWTRMRMVPPSGCGPSYAFSWPTSMRVAAEAPLSAPRWLRETMPITWSQGASGRSRYLERGVLSMALCGVPMIRPDTASALWTRSWSSTSTSPVIRSRRHSAICTTVLCSPFSPTCSTMLACKTATLEVLSNPFPVDIMEARRPLGALISGNRVTAPATSFSGHTTFTRHEDPGISTSLSSRASSSSCTSSLPVASRHSPNTSITSQMLQSFSRFEGNPKRDPDSGSTEEIVPSAEVVRTTRWCDRRSATAGLVILATYLTPDASSL
mmetsp:Transcript_27630/g.60478  ORF Transcript_27630/g.60478 Transcript_27630/m.60478 type:complete len:404 (-) Transcript_27630:2987-4198(-)